MHAWFVATTSFIKHSVPPFPACSRLFVVDKVLYIGQEGPRIDGSCRRLPVSRSGNYMNADNTEEQQHTSCGRALGGASRWFEDLRRERRIK